MAARRRRDAQAATRGRRDFEAVPGREPSCIAAEAPRADARRRDEPCPGEKGAARSVEVVEMLVMAEQHGIDLPEGFGRKRGRAFLGEGDRARGVAARLIEGGVGEEAHAADLQQREPLPREPFRARRAALRCTKTGSASPGDMSSPTGHHYLVSAIISGQNRRCALRTEASPRHRAPGGATCRRGRRP